MRHKKEDDACGGEDQHRNRLIGRKMGMEKVEDSSGDKFEKMGEEKDEKEIRDQGK